jgi:hypothetical protein
MNPTVTRKEIATAAGVSVSTVIRKEKKWGLDKLRSKAVESEVRFFRAQASRHLIAISVISQPI